MLEGRKYSRVHGHGGESGVQVFVRSLSRVARELLRWVELVLAAELVRRQAVVLPYLVQVRLGSDHHTRRLAVDEVLLPKTKGLVINNWEFNSGGVRVWCVIKHSDYTPCTLWHSIRKSSGCWCRTQGRPRHRRGPRPTGSQNLASPHAALGVENKASSQETQCTGQDDENLADSVIKTFKAMKTIPGWQWTPHQQVLLLTIDIGCADGVQGLVVFSDPLLTLQNEQKASQIITNKIHMC